MPTRSGVKHLLVYKLASSEAMYVPRRTALWDGLLRHAYRRRVGENGARSVYLVRDAPHGCVMMEGGAMRSRRRFGSALTL